MERSEIMFSHQKSVKKPFLYMTSPQGVLLCWIRVSCQTFKIDIERSFFKPPIFDHLKINGKVRNHVFSSEECKKAFFLYDLSPGSLALLNKSQLSNLQNRHREKLLNPPIFDHLITTGKVRNHVFSSEECIKAFFSVWPLPRESCFAE